MNSHDAQDRCDAILDAMSDSDASLWRNVGLIREDGRWLSEVLARLVLLIGDDEIRLVDGELESEEPPQGSLLVVTAHTIARADFTTQMSDGGYATTVVEAEAVPRSAATTVRVLTADTIRPGSEWPRMAQISVGLDHTFRGSSLLTIPVRPARGPAAAAVLQLASELARG